MYLPIPSLKNKYEIDARGNVRNARTKQRLKIGVKRQTPQVCVYVDGKSKSRSVRQLMWEVHGVKPKKTNFPKVSVWLFKGTEILYFESMRTAALCLSSKTFYDYSTIRKIFAKRKTEFKGWKIKYGEEEPRIIKSPDQILGAKYLRRENKYQEKKNKEKNSEIRQ